MIRLWTNTTTGTDLSTDKILNFNTGKNQHKAQGMETRADNRCYVSFVVSRRLIFTIVCARYAVRPKNPMNRRKSNRNWSPRPPWLLTYDKICKVFDLTGQKCELYKRIKICFLSSPAACKWQDMWEATGHKIMRVSGSQRAPCTGLGQAWSLSSLNSQNILSYSLSFCLLILLPFCVFVLSS